MDEIEQFLDAMRAQGLEPQDQNLLPDGKLHRFVPVGFRKDDNHAWYVLHLDTPASGAFGSWKSGEKFTWTAKVTRSLSGPEKETLKRRIEENKKQKEAEERRVRDEARHKAQAIWKSSTNEDHPYLAKKKIQAHTARVYTGALVIPVTNDGELVGLQFIQENSEKKFLTGTELKGSYCLVGPRPADKIVICEGFATAASIHEATGLPVFAAFNAGNLVETAKVLRKRLPDATIIIAADDDRWTTEPVPNPGVHYASLAAAEIRAEIRRPIFPPGTEGRPTDFNDLHVLAGLDEVAHQIKHGRPSFEDENLPANVRDERVLLEMFPHTNSRGKPLPTIENLAELLNRMNVTARYNVISKNVEILIPGESYSIDNRNNSSLSRVESWAARAGMSTGQVKAQLAYLADQNPFNPVATWITSRPWDGEKRLEKLFNTITATDEATNPTVKIMKEVFITRWLVSAVAGAFRPNGVAARGILVFQGAQNLGKTKWFKSLVPEHLEVVQDGMILRPEDKDSVKLIVSKWLVELGELDATFRRSDIAQLKAFITRDRDTLRLPFMPCESTFARRTVFFGSVNPREFLSDPTGNTRYWTISCEKIDHHHKIDMQQLWAEVYELYKAGESWYLSEKEMELLGESNKEFEVIDSMEERVRQRFQWETDKSKWSYISIKEIMDRMSLDNASRSDFTKCAQVVRKLNGNKGIRDYTGRKLFVPPFKEAAFSPVNGMM